MVAMLKSPTQAQAALQMAPAPVQLAAVNSLAARPGSRITPAQMAKIDQAAHQFEGVFMSEMLKPMFDTVKTDGMFGGGKAEDTFKSLLLEQYGRKIAQGGGLGLAAHVKAEMIQMQEAQK